MLKIKAKNIRLTTIIINHISANLRAYIISSLIFIVGIFVGVMFINNTQETKKTEISDYINRYITESKENGEISTAGVLKDNIKNNIILAVSLWFAGTTIIGIPIVFGIVFFRGFSLGYTISAIVYTMGLRKGIAFIVIAVLLQNLIFIPALIALSVSGIKLYKSIIKDRRKENIKLEILRHTIFSLIMLVLLMISAIIKINISGELLENLIKYF
ncbi:MAG: stage II sporulation protein M [Clostridia bacterium]|nr:stage II sporulation protein M [Clostridia bacterium]